MEKTRQDKQPTILLTNAVDNSQVIHISTDNFDIFAEYKLMCKSRALD